MVETKTEAQQPSGEEPVLPRVSVVIIGRNEAKNLPACVKSIRDMDYPPDLIEVLYVDTDSSDGSPDIARSLGVTVYEEHSDSPSPGRARNRGWREARYDIVHFIDGDMTISPEYLKKAVLYLAEGCVVCVFGTIDERRKGDNLVSRVMHYTWEVKTPGYVSAPGAGGTFLKSALADVGGYNPGLLQSEETEIGMRLREKRYRILLIDQLMGTHDYDITTIKDLATRFFKSTGYNYGKLLLTPPSEFLGHQRRSALRHLLQGFGALIVALVFVIAGKWYLVPVIALLVPFYVVMKYWNPAARRSQRITYFLMTYLAKPFIWGGMLAFFWNTLVSRAGEGHSR